MPRWPIGLQSNHSGAITLGKSEGKEKVILLGTAVTDGGKAFEVGDMDLHGKQYTCPGPQQSTQGLENHAKN